MNQIDNQSANVAIIGGGVAGMSCALWLKQLGYVPHIIECGSVLGGQLNTLHRINRWVLGFINQTSAEIAKRYSEHIINEQINCYYQSEIIAIETRAVGYYLKVKTQGESIDLTVCAMVIATGVRVAELFADINIAQYLQQQGQLSFSPFSHLEQSKPTNKQSVAVIGGGDNAHYTTHDIAQTALQTYLLMRSTPKAQQKIRSRVESLIEQGRVIEYQQTHIIDLSQTTEGKVKLLLSNSHSLEVDHVYIRVGFTPNSEFLKQFAPLQQITLNAHGYVITDSAKRSNIAGIYAIGDITNGTQQSIVSALADGAIAAQSISVLP